MLSPSLFGKTVDEESAMLLAKQDDGPVATGLPLAWPRNPLLEHTAAEIGIYLTGPRASHRVDENRIGDTLLTAESLKPGILKYPHRVSQCIKYNTKCYI